MENKNYKTAKVHMVFIMRMETQFQRSYEIRREEELTIMYPSKGYCMKTRVLHEDDGMKGTRVILV